MADGEYRPSEAVLLCARRFAAAFGPLASPRLDSREENVEIAKKVPQQQKDKLSCPLVKNSLLNWGNA